MMKSFSQFSRETKRPIIVESAITESTDNWHKSKSDFHKQAAAFMEKGGLHDAANFQREMADYHSSLASCM